MMNPARIVCVLLAVTAGLGATAAAQDPNVRLEPNTTYGLGDAKVLYDDAMYEEALKLLDRIVSETNPEIHQYRALCLIALGRTDAADREIAIVVGADPFFTPDPESVAPRVVSMFASARRRLLPPMVRRAFAEATALFRDGQRQRANERFDEVLRLLDDSALKDDQSLADLKLVATAFVELVRIQPPAPQPLPSRAVVQPVEPGPRPDSSQPKPAEVPRKPLITPPVAIAQEFPLWNPPDAVTARHSYTGAIKVSIDKDGKVISAARERTVHPAYDRIVLEAARGWLYRPATRDGQPITSETTVEIRLEPLGN